MFVISCNFFLIPLNWVCFISDSPVTVWRNCQFLWAGVLLSNLVEARAVIPHILCNSSLSGSWTRVHIRSTWRTCWTPLGWALQTEVPIQHVGYNLLSSCKMMQLLQKPHFDNQCSRSVFVHLVAVRNTWLFKLYEVRFKKKILYHLIVWVLSNHKSRTFLSWQKAWLNRAALDCLQSWPGCTGRFLLWAVFLSCIYLQRLVQKWAKCVWFRRRVRSSLRQSASFSTPIIIASVLLPSFPSSSPSPPCTSPAPKGIHVSS